VAHEFTINAQAVPSYIEPGLPSAEVLVYVGAPTGTLPSNISPSLSTCTHAPDATAGQPTAVIVAWHPFSCKGVPVGATNITFSAVSEHGGCF